MLTFCQGCRLCSPNKRDSFLWWLKNVSVMKYKQWWAETSCTVKPSHQTVQSPTLLWPILLESFLLPCRALPCLAISILSITVSVLYFARSMPSPFHYIITISAYLNTLLKYDWNKLQIFKVDSLSSFDIYVPRKASGVGNGNPLQYSCLGNMTGRGTWWATVHRAAKSRRRQITWAQESIISLKMVSNQSFLKVSSYFVVILASCPLCS